MVLYRLNRLHLLSMAFFLAGCGAPEKRSLDAAKLEERFRARSLGDPGLLEFLEANLPRRPDPFPPARWDLNLLTLAAFYFHPNLEGARARLEKARGGELTAAAWPNPAAGAGLDHNLDLPRSTSPWTWIFDLSFPIEIGGKRQHRKARALALSEAARAGLAEAAWRVRQGLRAALVEHLAARRALDSRRAEESARGELAALLEARLEAGMVSSPEVDAARRDHAKARAARLSAEAREAGSRAELATALGLPLAALEKAVFDERELDRLPEAEALGLPAVQRAGLLNRLDLLKLLREFEAADAALRLELAKRFPEVSLGPGYLFEEGENKFTFGLTITLPVLNQNSGPIAEAAAARKEAAARFLELEERVVNGIEAALARYRLAREEFLETGRQQALAAALEEAARREAEIGQKDRLELALARVGAALAREAGIAALRQAQLALASLEEGMQSPLGGAPPLPPVSTTSPRPSPQEEDIHE